MVSGILLLTYYKNYDFFHNHVSKAAVLSPSFKNDVRFLDILQAYRIVREHYRPAIQLGLRHFLRPFKRLDKKALKLHFQHKNDRTKTYFIFMKLIWLKLLDDRDTIYNL